MKKLVAAIDGTAKDFGVLKATSTLANAFDSEVLLIHIVSEASPTPEQRHWVEIEQPNRLINSLPTFDQESAAELNKGSIAGLLSTHKERDRLIKYTIADALIERAKKTLASDGVHNISHLIRTGDVDSLITSLAKEHAADLIILGTRRLSGMAGALLGATSQRVNAHSDIPILLTRPSAFSGADDESSQTA